ncbi:hypothetical protein CBA19CS22_13280 [Caballeronia novacaledonica]|uniref:Uncharacterized protein n=1 Tax=Caballeronia novacaledonica TaxID=1544861 RepID=A0ACB5QSC9_9BURK|nr:hypothetical protein CBA19CS22_13280 [Caballeronia novacaledonica]
MTNDPEACRYVLKLLGDVFAQRLHLATAFRTLPGRFGQVRPDLARQMLRQWLARCLFHNRARRLWDFDRRRAFIGLKLLEAQLELLDLMVQLLRLATELHTAQLGNEQLQVFDFGCARCQRDLLRVDRFLQFEHLRVALTQRRLLAEQHRLQRLDIVGKWAHARHAASLCVGNDVYNAEVGRAVLVGCRQSMPSSSIDSCAGLRQITPPSA